MAWALLCLRGSIPDILSVYIGNSLILCGFALELAAITTIGKAPQATRFWNRSYAILAAAGTSVFWIIAIAPTDKVGASSIAVASLFLAAVVSILSPPTRSKIRLATGAMYAVLALAFAVRSVVGFTHPGIHLLSNNSIQLFTFLLLYVLMFLGGIAFLLILKVSSEELLAESEEKYSRLLELANEAIVIIQDERIAYANQRSAELFKLPREKVIGAPMLGLVPPPGQDEVRRRYDAALSGGGGPIRFDLEIVAADGATNWVLVSASAATIGGKRAVLAVLTDIGERKKDEERIKLLNLQLEAERNRAELIAVTDGLTRLNNRRLFDERLVAEFYRLKRSGAPLSLAMIDVDHFKVYNDELGHPAGDECLKRVAAAVAGSARRPADCAARYGGEEFTVILPEMERDKALAQAERIRAAVEGLGIPHPSGGSVTVSVGIVTALPSMMSVPESIVEMSDRALYKAKAGGRNRVETFMPSVSERDIEDGLARLYWRSADECGQPTIDRQHRELIDTSNVLLRFVMEDRTKDELRPLLFEFAAKIERHFGDEEDILASTTFPEGGRHAALHAELLARTRDVISAFERAELGAGELFGFIAYEVVLRHMHVEDREYFPYLDAVSKN